jgi:hypothetical protein
MGGNIVISIIIIGKQPFMSHRPDSIQFSLLWISQQYFLQSRVVSLAPNQISVFVSPSDRLAQLYPQAPGFLFVAFYESHGYGGGSLTGLHAGDRTYVPCCKASHPRKLYSKPSF